MVHLSHQLIAYFTIALLIALATMATAAEPGAGDWLTPYDVVWTTPSVDAAGSMPLGNGEVGINLWVEANGDLNFYVSRSDSFSEISRLLKVGQVRVSISPNPFATGQPFHQRLNLRDGVCEITAGDGAAKVSIRVWVDPYRPVVRVFGQADSPVSVKATLISWRTDPHTIAKAEEKSAWTMHGSQAKLVESADVFPPTQFNEVSSYHRNQTSAVPSTIEVQSLGPIADKIRDPLLNRTFGIFLVGTGSWTTHEHTTQLSDPGKVFDLRAVVPCVQCAKADDWTKEAVKILGQSMEKNPNEFSDAAKWWHDFWDRSWVNTSAGQGITAPTNAFPLRVGMDSNQQNQFPGTITDAASCNGVVPAEQITRPLAKDSHADFTGSFTLQATIKPDHLVPGRIFDKLTAGHNDGFLFDTHPGNTLRLIVGNDELSAPPHILKAGVPQQVAATLDAATGAMRIFLDGKLVAERTGSDVSPITRGYVLQRYVQACGGRGTYPIKFNGGIFTVEPKNMGQPFNADYRAWGDCFWWQNTRHMYHPMLASGDTGMMDSLFRMYEAAVPLAEARSALYHQCEGSYFPETMTAWGTYSNGDYGWNRDGHQPQDVMCPYWQYAWNQGPELVDLMLDRWDYTADSAFLKQQLLPMATSVLKYFDTRFKRDANGRIILDPTQSVETFWSGVTNDMPSVAGLNDITRRLCDLPDNVPTAEQRAFFTKMKNSCPVIPIEDRTIDGTTVRLLAPAEKFKDERSNCENPELYAVWPFRIFGIGKPGLDEAIAAYNHRVNHLDVGWGPDGNCAALLGLTDEAARILQKKCANSRHGYRWPATWGPNFDWLPDQNHGGNLLETTQLMLLQCDGNKIRLLPAWPKDWDVSFKLRATQQTTVECVYRKGKFEKLEVTPATRRDDVVLPSWK